MQGEIDRLAALAEVGEWVGNGWAFWMISWALG